MSEPKIVLTAEDFVDTDFIMVRPRLVQKFGGDVASVLMIARIQFRSNVSIPDADGLKWWRATYPELSRETGLSADQAKRTIDKLVEKGVVLAKIENDSSWDRTRSYRVDVRSVHLAIPPDASGDSALCMSRNRQINLAESPDLLSTKEALKNLRTNAQPAPAEPDTFPEFWAAYPRKAGKRKAEPAYRRALKRATAEEILAGAERYRDWPGRSADIRFTKYPEGWLNGDMWGDELPAVVEEVRSSGLVERNGEMMTRANAEAFDLWRSMQMSEAVASVALDCDPHAHTISLEGAPW